VASLNGRDWNPVFDKFHCAETRRELYDGATTQVPRIAAIAVETVSTAVETQAIEAKSIATQTLVEHEQTSQVSKTGVTLRLDEIVGLLLANSNLIAANVIDKYPKTKSTQTETGATAALIENKNETIGSLETSACPVCLTELMEAQSWCVRPCGHITCYSCSINRLNTDQQRCVCCRNSSYVIRFPMEPSMMRSAEERRQVKQVVRFTCKTKVNYAEELIDTTGGVSSTDVAADVMRGLQRIHRPGICIVRGTQTDGPTTAVEKISSTMSRVFRSRCLYCKIHQLDVTGSCITDCGYLVCGDREACDDRQLIWGTTFDIATTIETGVCRGCNNDTNSCRIHKLYPSGNN
jgi:hypothetical protein